MTEISPAVMLGLSFACRFRSRLFSLSLFIVINSQRTLFCMSLTLDFCVIVR